MKSDLKPMKHPSPRDKTEKSFNHLYEMLGHLGDPCTYCGTYSEVMDHVPPLRSLQFLTIEEAQNENPIRVPCCKECNSALGSKPLHTIKARKNFITEFLRKKYIRLIEMPDWSADEIEEMGYSMRSVVAASTRNRKLVIERIRWANGK